MKNADQSEKKSLKARLKMAVAGLALAGALAGGVSMTVDADPAPAEDTTETARISMRVSIRSHGISWL